MRIKFLEWKLPEVKALTCNQDELDKKVAEGVAAALEAKKLQDEYEELSKQFPKVVTTKITEGYNPIFWQVGDWLVSNGMVYEIVDAAQIQTTHISNFYWFQHALPEQRKLGYASYTYKMKLKTVPFKGQEAVEGWIDIDQNTPGNMILRRTLNGIKLKKEPTLDNS